MKTNLKLPIEQTDGWWLWLNHIDRNGNEKILIFYLLKRFRKKHHSIIGAVAFNEK